MTITGLERDLPICRVTDDLYIAGFVIFGDPELTCACADAREARNIALKRETDERKKKS